MFFISYFLIFKGSSEAEAREKFTKFISSEIREDEVKNLETSVTSFSSNPSLIVFDYMADTPGNLSFIKDQRKDFFWKKTDLKNKEVCNWVTNGNLNEDNFIIYEKSYANEERGSSKVKSYLCFNPLIKKGAYQEDE